MGCLYAMMLAAASVGVDNSRGQGAPDMRCGSYALFVGLKALDRGPATFSDLERALGPPGEKGYSMAQLAEQARKYGITALAVRTTLANLELRAQPFVCICLLSRSHFMLLQGVDRERGMAQMIDPPDSYSLPLDTFGSAWHGEALLMASQPLVPEEALSKRSTASWLWGGLGASIVSVVGVYLAARGRWNSATRAAIVGLVSFGLSGPGCGRGREADTHAQDPAATTNRNLVAEPQHHLLGKVPIPSPGRPTRVETVLINRSTKPIEILEMRQSCGCTNAAVGTTRIEPGARTKLISQIALGIEPGPRRSSVTLTTNDAQEPVITVDYEWQVINPLHTEPEVCDFSRVRSNERKKSTVSLMAEGLPICDRCSVQVEVGASGAAGTFTPSIGQGRPESASQGVGHGRVVLGEIQVEVVGSDEAQSHKDGLTVALRCGEATLGRYLLPVTWESSPSLLTSPGRLWLGERKAGEAVPCRVVVTSSDRTPLIVRAVACDDPHALMIGETPQGARPMHIVAFTALMPAADGPWRTMVRVVTDNDGGREVVVPLSANIVKPEG